MACMCKLHPGDDRIKLLIADLVQKLLLKETEMSLQDLHHSVQVVLIFDELVTFQILGIERESLFKYLVCIFSPFCENALIKGKYAYLSDFFQAFVFHFHLVNA